MNQLNVFFRENWDHEYLAKVSQARLMDIRSIRTSNLPINSEIKVVYDDLDSNRPTSFVSIAHRYSFMIIIFLF